MLADRRRSRPGHDRVTVLGSFTATAGDPGRFGGDARRAVTYLALHRRAARAELAANLWPGLPAVDALEMLDETLPAPLAAGLLVVEADGAVALSPTLDVDLDEAMALVRTLSDGPERVPADLEAARTLLGADLLPGESAAWLAVERERFRQIRLNALEELSAALSAVGRHAEAVAVAADAVRSAPSRETARRALIEAHLAQGAIAEAVAEYDEYQDLLRTSVGAPSAFGLEGLLPPEPAWPVLRVRRATQRVGMAPPGVRLGRPIARRLVAGGSVPGTTR
jgi:DNA-binding SARP family transcriptional activator